MDTNLHSEADLASRLETFGDSSSPKRNLMSIFIFFINIYQEGFLYKFSLSFIYDSLK